MYSTKKGVGLEPGLSSSKAAFGNIWVNSVFRIISIQEKLALKNECAFEKNAVVKNVVKMRHYCCHNIQVKTASYFLTGLGEICASGDKCSQPWE